MDGNMAISNGFSAGDSKPADAGGQPKTQFDIQVQNVE
jgi:hypothetical protein